jgi:hypothetical protein
MTPERQYKILDFIMFLFYVSYLINMWYQTLHTTHTHTHTHTQTHTHTHILIYIYIYIYIQIQIVSKLYFHRTFYKYQCIRSHVNFLI